MHCFKSQNVAFDSCCILPKELNLIILFDDNFQIRYRLKYNFKCKQELMYENTISLRLRNFIINDAIII